MGFELYQSMLEDAILAAKAGDIGLARERDALSPQITVDAPIMIPEDYVPDLAVRMALYRRMNDADGADGVEALAAEMIAGALDGAPSAIERDLLEAVDPARGLRRALRRSGRRVATR